MSQIITGVKWPQRRVELLRDSGLLLRTASCRQFHRARLTSELAASQSDRKNETDCHHKYSQVSCPGFSTNFIHRRLASETGPSEKSCWLVDSSASISWSDQSEGGREEGEGFSGEKYKVS